MDIVKNINGQKCIVTFTSIHYVIKAESMLKNAGIWTDMVPNPRRITSDCGMALFILCSNVDSVRDELKEKGLFKFNIYRRDGDLFQLITGGENNG